MTQRKVKKGLGPIGRMLWLVALSLWMGMTPVGAENDSLIDMAVTDASVRDVLMSLASVGQVNLVVDDSVTGSLTVQLSHVSFEDALATVAQTKGLIVERLGNVIVVAASKSRTRFSAIHVVKLQHVKAEDVIDKVALLLRDSPSSQAVTQKSSSRFSSNRVMSSVDRGAMTTKKILPYDDICYERTKVDTISNSIVFLGSQQELAEVRVLLAELDVPYPEVLVEAKIVSLDRTASKELGIDWTWSVIHQAPVKVQYEATLHDLEKQGNVKVLAQPKILAINGKAAFIQVGDTLPIIQQTQTNISTLSGVNQYIDSGIILTYIPFIHADHSITAQVQTEVSIPTWVSDLKTYEFSKKIADTEVRMQDGETIAIGGLMNTQDTKGLARIPFLSDLPFLGGLFKSTADSKDDHEVMIFITAHIVKDEQK
jgi:type IV pilus assembly protein PilQ